MVQGSVPQGILLRNQTLTVRLPNKRRVSDLLTGRVVATRAARFDVDIAPVETLFYRLQ